MQKMWIRKHLYLGFQKEGWISDQAQEMQRLQHAMDNN
jgi:hypothetical protein